MEKVFRAQDHWRLPPVCVPVFDEIAELLARLGGNIVLHNL
mgnify:CR=1 FL=1